MNYTKESSFLDKEHLEKHILLKIFKLMNIKFKSSWKLEQYQFKIKRWHLKKPRLCNNSVTQTLLSFLMCTKLRGRRFV